MSYTTFDEMQEHPMTLKRMWFSNGIIPSRTVELRSNTEDTIRFQPGVKDEEPPFDVKFQIPCDTVTSSSSCYQESKKLFLVR